MLKNILPTSTPTMISQESVSPYSYKVIHGQSEFLIRLLQKKKKIQHADSTSKVMWNLKNPFCLIPHQVISQSSRSVSSKIVLVNEKENVRAYFGSNFTFISSFLLLKENKDPKKLTKKSKFWKLQEFPPAFSMKAVSGKSLKRFIFILNFPVARKLRNSNFHSAPLGTF